MGLESAPYMDRMMLIIMLMYNKPIIIMMCLSIIQPKDIQIKINEMMGTA